MRFVTKPVDPVERTFDVLDLTDEDIKVITYALQKHRENFALSPTTVDLERRFRHFRDSEGLRPFNLKKGFTD